MKKFLLLLIAITLPIKFAFGEGITGLWRTTADPQGNIPIANLFEKDNKFYAVFFSFSSDNKIFKSLKEFKNAENPKDTENPDESLRDRYQRDILVVSSLEKKGNKLKNGKIYNPKSGKYYYFKGKILEDENKIVWKASIDKGGVFGKKFIWEREKPAKIYKLFEHSQKDLESLVDKMIKNQETKKI